MTLRSDKRCKNSSASSSLPPPKKSLSQNFCHDQGVLSRIAQALSFSATGQLWEIGAGRGALTSYLCGKAALTRIFEIDHRLRTDLEKVLQNHHIITHWGDFLALDLQTLWQAGPQPGVITGNLPYHCGTAMVRRVLQLHPAPQTLVFLLQEEVARKMVAAPGSAEYGFLSVEIQWWATGKILEIVTADSFWPKPAVQSAVLCLQPFSSLSPTDRAQRQSATAVVSRAFQQRRKKALTTLQKAFPAHKQWWPEQFDVLGLAHDLRPERISPPSWLELGKGLHCQQDFSD